MVPTKLDLEQIILSLPRFKNRGKIEFVDISHGNDGHKVPLPPYYYIIYSVFVKDKILKKEEEDEAPVRLSMQMVKKITGNTSYLLDLIDAGIIERYGGYAVGSHSYSYRFTEKYLDFDFGFKSYKGKHSLKLGHLREGMNEGHLYALDSLKHLEVDEKEARALIRNIKNKESKERQTVILNEFLSQRSQGVFEGTVGEVSNRLFYFPTCQKRNLRKTWSMGGAHVAIFDVKSCQPALLFTFYPEKEVGSEEWRHYKNLIENPNAGAGFYEYLQESIYADTNHLFGRDRAKVLLYKLWFGNPCWKNLDQDVLDMKKAFSDTFPILTEEILKIKKDNHAVMAARLQSLESGIMFNKVVIKCKEQNIPCLTIHDSIVCNPQHRDFVQETMYQEFSAVTGLCVRIDEQRTQPAPPPTPPPLSGVNPSQQTV